jgi:hypothetical protein
MYKKIKIKNNYNNQNDDNNKYFINNFNKN